VCVCVCVYVSMLVSVCLPPFKYKFILQISANIGMNVMSLEYT